MVVVDRTWAACALMAALLLVTRGHSVLAEDAFSNLIGALVDNGVRSGVEA